MSSRFIADEGDFRVTRGGRDITGDAVREAKAQRIQNIFCKTGQGGGVDPTCTKDAPDTGGGSGGGGSLIKSAAETLQTKGSVKLESDDSDGGKSRLIVKKSRGSWVSDHYGQAPGEEGFTKSEGFHLGSTRTLTAAQALDKAVKNFGNVHRIVANAFPPAAGGAPAAGGTTRPKLDMPLLPENLRIADGEADPNAVEVSRDDLLKIKEVIDRLLSEHDAQQQAGAEDQSSPDGKPSSDTQQIPAEDDAATQDVTDTSVSEKSFPADKSKDDINKEDALPQQDAAAAADGEQDPLKRKYKGFFNAT